MINAKFCNGRTNGNICLGGDSCEPKKKKKKNLAVIVVASVGAVVCVCTAAIFLLCILKKRKGELVLLQNKVTDSEFTIRNYGIVLFNSSAKCTINELQNGGKYQLENRKFTYKELEFITDNFSKIIGKGGFGTVFYGHLEDRTEVAVKLLTKSSSQGKEDFLSEVTDPS